MEWNNLLSALLGALLGGILSLAGSWLAVKLTYKMNRKIDEENSIALVTGFLHTIRSDIESLYKGYFESIGNVIETISDGQPVLSIYIVDEDYFTVYNSNANLLVKIKDNHLRQEIVNTYNIAKSLIDSYRVNNHLLGKFEQMFTKSIDTQNKTYITISQNLEGDLKKMASTLKILHNRAKDQYSSLTSLLKSHGIYGPGEISLDGKQP